MTVTPDGVHHCDVQGCKSLGHYYGMDGKGEVADLCKDDYLVYCHEVDAGNEPSPRLTCASCGAIVTMTPNQFYNVIKVADVRGTDKTYNPEFVCRKPGCKGLKTATSHASLDAGFVVFVRKAEKIEEVV